MSNKSATADRSRQLVQWFKAIGEAEPDFAAQEEIEGGGYLARALFLRGVGRCLNDTAVVDPNRLEYPGGPEALRQLLASGVAIDDLRTALRAAQWQSLWQLVCMIDDSLTGIGDIQETIDDVVQWRLFRVDEDGKPLVPLSSLHEDLVDAVLPPDGPTAAAKPKTLARVTTTRRKTPSKR
jgi:hypothetical protein